MVIVKPKKVLFNCSYKTGHKCGSLVSRTVNIFHYLERHTFGTERLHWT